MEKTLRYWVACCLLVLAASTRAQSEDIIKEIRSTTPQERAEAQAEVLSDVLGLDRRQTDKLVEINLKYSRRIQALMDAGAEDTVLFSNIQRFAAQKDEEIEAMLTKEQIDRYQAHKARLRRIVEDVIQHRNR